METYRPGMNRHQKIIKREIKIFAILLAVLLSINILPGIFGFNQQSTFYQKYYTDVLPFSITGLLLTFFLLRLIYVITRYYFKLKK